ncbi:hypothetical protein Pelo_6082 [Pelomyxa schiedti]|nr:hypothetical protein Pelo_6082 [Pelomyxa schiedti]
MSDLEDQACGLCVDAQGTVRQGSVVSLIKLLYQPGKLTEDAWQRYMEVFVLNLTSFTKPIRVFPALFSTLQEVELQLSMHSEDATSLSAQRSRVIKTLSKWCEMASSDFVPSMQTWDYMTWIRAATSLMFPFSHKYARKCPLLALPVEFVVSAALLARPHHYIEAEKVSLYERLVKVCQFGSNDPLWSDFVTTAKKLLLPPQGLPNLIESPESSSVPQPFPKCFLKKYPRLGVYITLLNLHQFQQIPLREFLVTSWRGPRKELRVPHILAVQYTSATVSHWVASEILSVQKLKNRTKLLTLFIGLASDFLGNHDYPGAYSILVALTSSPIRRLQQTWDKVPSEFKQKFNSLESFFSLHTSVNGMRSALALSCPIIPVISIFRSDITFTCDLPTGLPSHLTFGVFYKVSAILRRIHSFQQQSRNYTTSTPPPVPPPQVQALIHMFTSAAIHTFDEEPLWLQSLQLEPRRSTLYQAL